MQLTYEKHFTYFRVVVNIARSALKLLDDFEVIRTWEVRFDLRLIRVERSVETTESCEDYDNEDLLAPNNFAFLIFQMLKSRNMDENCVALGANK